MSIKLACLTCGQGNRIPKDRPRASAKCAICGARLVKDTPTDISLDVLGKAERLDELPLLVDFWASWCGPCRVMAPEFARAAKALDGIARLAKLDTEAFPQAGARYRITGIPLLVAFRSGREIGRRTGLIRAKEIAGWIDAEAAA